MKKPNTLPELLRYAASLAEKGESLAGKFEYRNTHNEWEWVIYDGSYPPITDARIWRIVDKVTKKYEAPKTFMLDGVELNRPYESAPVYLSDYWAANLSDSVGLSHWDGFKCDLRHLENHNCWRTEADAKAYQAVIKGMMDKALGVKV